MPYTKRSGGWETARSIGHVPLVESEIVRASLQRWHVLAGETSPQPDSSLIVPADRLASPDGDLRWAFSFDGSLQEVSAREGYPSTRIGYLQIAGVLVHLGEMLDQGNQRLVDPAIIREAADQALLPIALPGSNVCRPDMRTVRDSWRAEVFDIFRTYRVEQSTLLDVLMLLVGFSAQHARKGRVILARCSASDSCEARDLEVDTAGSACPRCHEQLFPTDILRVHEEVSEEHENATALGRLMSTLEHLTMVAYLNYLLQRRPQVLASVGFILDGPLAVFGPQAWLQGPILSFILDLQQKLRVEHLGYPVILGIEKSGQFADHAQDIRDRIPRRHLMILPDSYIYEHVLTFRTLSSAPFGRDTYYGQKFFYKTEGGQLLTISVPKLGISVTDADNPIHYPIMPNTLRLLDKIGTTLYQDAVIPVALAHSFASIPLRTGSKVLTLMSKENFAAPLSSAGPGSEASR